MRLADTYPGQQRMPAEANEIIWHFDLVDREGLCNRIRRFDFRLCFGGQTLHGLRRYLRSSLRSIIPFGFSGRAPIGTAHWKGKIKWLDDPFFTIYVFGNQWLTVQAHHTSQR